MLQTGNLALSGGCDGPSAVGREVSSGCVGLNDGCSVGSSDVGCTVGSNNGCRVSFVVG